MNQRSRNRLFFCAAAVLMGGGGATPAAPTTDASVSQFCAYGNFRNCQATGSAGLLGGQFPGSFAGASSRGLFGGTGGGGGGSTGSRASQSTPSSGQVEFVDALIHSLLPDQSWRGPSIWNRRGMGDSGSGSGSAGSSGSARTNDSAGSSGSARTNGSAGSSGSARTNGSVGSSGGAGTAGSVSGIGRGPSSASAQGNLGLGINVAGQQYDAILGSAVSMIGDGPDIGVLGLPGSLGGNGGVPASKLGSSSGGVGGGGLNAPAAAPIPATLALIAVGFLGLRLARRR